MGTFFDWSNPLLAIAMLGVFAVMVIGLEVASSGDRKIILARRRIERRERKEWAAVDGDIRRMPNTKSHPPRLLVATVGVATLAAWAGFATIGWNWWHGVESPQWLVRWSVLLGSLGVVGELLAHRWGGGSGLARRPCSEECE